MKSFQEMIMVGEIVLQAKIAKRAAERLQATHDNFDHIETWCSIQSILGAAANVSKILWPDKKYKTRGENLRQFLKVEKDNPLCSRKFRNHFEHYDERIEEYFQNISGGVYVDLAMNPSMRDPFFPNSTSNTHRGYNSFNNTIVFRGEILDVAELLAALDQILKDCKPWSLG
jgi:hypothetical protein